MYYTYMTTVPVRRTRFASGEWLRSLLLCVGCGAATPRPPAAKSCEKAEKKHTLFLKKHTVFKKNIPYFRKKTHPIFENTHNVDFGSAVDNSLSAAVSRSVVMNEQQHTIIDISRAANNNKNNLG
jgi:hypothetical protein